MTDPLPWLQALMVDPALTTTQKAVGAALWTWMDRRGTCYPSVPKIAERAGCKKRDTARLALVALESSGYLVRIVQPDGFRTTNVYRAALPVENQAKVVRLAGRGGTRLTGRGGTRLTDPLGSPSNGSRTTPIELNAPSLIFGMSRDHRMPS